MISTAPCPINTEDLVPTMSIAMAITTQVQPSTAPGGAGLSGGGGGGPPGGGGAPGGEEACQVEEEGETPCKPLSVMENPWARYPPYLREIAQKLRAFSESFPPISSLTMMSQLLPPSLNELPLPSPASKDQRSTDGPNSSSNG